MALLQNITRVPVIVWGVREKRNGEKQDELDGSRVGGEIAICIM